VRATTTGFRRFLIPGAAIVGAVLLMAAAMTSGAGVAEAHGVSPAKLNRAGWDCDNIVPLGVHCFSPGSGASSASISVLVFDTTDEGATVAPFLGAEILIRADLYHGQPCPQDDLDEYHGLDLFGGPAIDYYACHFYDTSP
jgi:hypothetical protein